MQYGFIDSLWIVCGFRCAWVLTDLAVKVGFKYSYVGILGSIVKSPHGTGLAGVVSPIKY